MTVRVLVVDDEAMVRLGLRLVLESEPEIEVVGEAGDGAEAVRLAAHGDLDVVLLDVRMPVLDGIGAARRILALPHPPAVVMLTTFHEAEYVREALDAGVSGFLLKVAPPERLVEAVLAAAGGDALLDPLVSRTVIEAYQNAARPQDPATLPASYSTLTAREREVLRLLARGLSNVEVAQELVISDTTVKTHVARILMKLGLRDRVQAVVFAFDHGLARPVDT